MTNPMDNPAPKTIRSGPQDPVTSHRSRTSQAVHSGGEIFASAAVLGKDGLHHGTDAPNVAKGAPVATAYGHRSRIALGDMARAGTVKTISDSPPGPMQKNRTS